MVVFKIASAITVLIIGISACKPARQSLESSSLRTTDGETAKLTSHPPKRMIFTHVEMPTCRTMTLPKVKRVEGQPFRFKTVTAQIINLVDMTTARHMNIFPYESNCYGKTVRTRFGEYLPITSETLWKPGEDVIGKNNELNLQVTDIEGKTAYVIRLRDYGNYICPKLDVSKISETLEILNFKKRNCSTIIYNRLVETSEVKNIDLSEMKPFN